MTGLIKFVKQRTPDRQLKPVGPPLPTVFERRLRNGFVAPSFTNSSSTKPTNSRPANSPKWPPHVPRIPYLTLSKNGLLRLSVPNFIAPLLLCRCAFGRLCVHAFMNPDKSLGDGWSKGEGERERVRATEACTGDNLFGPPPPPGAHLVCVRVFASSSQKWATFVPSSCVCMSFQPES